VANCYLYSGKLQGAIDEYEALLADLNKEGTENLEHKADVIIDLTVARGKMGEFGKAIETGERGLRMLEGLELGNPKSYYSLVEDLMICYLCRGAKGDNDAAVSLYNTAVSKVPFYVDPSAESTYILSLICDGQKAAKILEAFGHLTEVMQPDDTVLIGLYDLHIGRTAEAISAFSSAMKLPPGLYCSQNEILAAVHQTVESGWGSIPLVTHLLETAENPNPNGAP